MNTKTVVELKQQRAALVDEAQKMLDTSSAEKRDLNTDEQKRWNQIMADIDNIALEVGDDINSSHGLAEINRRMNQTDRSVASRSLMYGQSSPEPEKANVLTKEKRMADLFQTKPEDRSLSIGKYVKGLITGDWNGADAERRAMAEGTLSSGGYMVPTPLSTTVIDLARNAARVVQAGAVTVPMATSTLTMAKLTGDATAYWKAENAAGTFSDLSFDAITFKAKTLMALVKISVELMEDASNIDTVINNSIAQALALELDRVALYGTGTDPQPKGLKNVTGVLSASMGANGATISSYDVFSQAVQDIQQQNGQPNSVIYAPRTAGEIDRLKDSQGRPLEGPASFKNLGKYVTNQIPTNLTVGTGTTCSDAFVGDFSQLMVGMRNQIQFEISRTAADSSGSAFTNYQVWLRAVLRADIQVARPQHFEVIKGIL